MSTFLEKAGCLFLGLAFIAAVMALVVVGSFGFSREDSREEFAEEQDARDDCGRDEVHEQWLKARLERYDNPCPPAGK